MTAEPGLTQSYATTGDERAFARLVEAHGPMVLAVCQRILRRREDAEDACQAVFLVLARSAGALRDESRLPGWLHRVATRTAWRLHRQLAARAEVSLENAAELAASVLSPEEDWQPALDAECARLPERYRLPLVMRYLEGQSSEAVAAKLGLTPAGLKTRLDRARALLRERLARRGLTVAASVAALHFLSHEAIAAAVLPRVVASTRAIALSQSIQHQLQLTAIMTKLLPVAAAIVLAAVVSPSESTSAESAAPSSASTTAAVTGPRGDTLADVERRYPYVVAWSMGDHDFPGGDEITIKQVRGTKPTLAPGGRYLVRGTYDLRSVARARLYFGLTASNADGYTATDEPQQAVWLTRGTGEFILSRFFQNEGDPHVSLYREKGANFGGVYFGDERGVLRDKGYQRTTSEAVAKTEASGEVMKLKIRADGGDKEAARELGYRYAEGEEPDLVQAYRWLRVAGDEENLAEVKKALTPEQLAEAERLAVAYINRPTAPPAR